VFGIGVFSDGLEAAMFVEAAAARPRAAWEEVPVALALFSATNRIARCGNGIDTTRWE
jgi:hypothetical protein